MTALAGVVAVINVIGVRRAAWTINVFTIAKLAPLALLIVLGLPQVEAEHRSLARRWPSRTGPRRSCS